MSSLKRLKKDLKTIQESHISEKLCSSLKLAREGQWNIKAVRVSIFVVENISTVA